jgi:hypothetical protein
MSGPTIKSAFNYAAPSPADTDVQEFTSSGTWIKPAGANMVMVEAWGGGGGGGGGVYSGGNSTGGAGGAGGGYVSKTWRVSELPSTVVVTVGAGGIGGIAQTSSGAGAAGAAGTSGGISSFGSLMSVFGGFGGIGGNPSGTSSSGSLAGALYASGGPSLTSVSNSNGQFGAGQGSFSAWAGGNGTSAASFSAGGVSYFGGCGGGGAFPKSANATAVGINGSPGSSRTSSGAIAAGTPANKNGANGVNDGDSGGSGCAVIIGSTAVAVVSLAYGDGKFAAFNGNSYIFTSTNGTTWTVGFTNLNARGNQSNCGFRNRLYYLNSLWIILGEQNTPSLLISTDLVNWTINNSVGSSVTNYGMAFFSGTYAITSDTAASAIRTSTDLITWTTRYSANSMYDVIHDGTRWIAVGPSGRSLTSTDAITWTLVTTAASGNWYKVASNGAASNATLVALSDATPFAWRSTNSGATWTAVATTLTASGTSAGSIIYAGGQFMITIASIVYTSTDGNTWTTQTDGTTDAYCQPAYSGSIYFVGSITPSANFGISSPTGVTWTTRSISTTFGQSGGNGGNGAMSGGGGGGAVTADLVGLISGAGGNGGNGKVRVTSW